MIAQPHDPATPASAAPAPSAGHRGPGPETRVDVLSGDRCCARCGFNLYGQTIIREPHYGLLMVRCPECGTAAAMQEYVDRFEAIPVVVLACLSRYREPTPYEGGSIYPA